jgi:hypothetical protein
MGNKNPAGGIRPVDQRLIFRVGAFEPETHGTEKNRCNDFESRITGNQLFE